MRAKFKTLVVLVMMMAVVLGVCPAPTEAASAIKLNKTKMTMYVGDTYMLKLKKQKEPLPGLRQMKKWQPFPAKDW